MHKGSVGSCPLESRLCLRLVNDRGEGYLLPTWVRKITLPTFRLNVPVVIREPFYLCSRSHWKIVEPPVSTERPASESPCLLCHCVWRALSDSGEKETDRVTHILMPRSWPLVTMETRRVSWIAQRLWYACEMPRRRTLSKVPAVTLNPYTVVET